MRPQNVRFFESAAEFREWLKANTGHASQLWLGLYKKTSGKPGLGYAEAVDEALCFGWIDGQLAGLDTDAYAIRFTPRRSHSNWSTTNVQRVGELLAAGRMRSPGMRAFEARTPERTGVYMGDAGGTDLDADLERQFRADPKAWDFWMKQPPGYRRQMTWWVVSAKREDTRRRRLAALIAEHAAERRIDPLKLPSVAKRTSDG